MEITVSNFRKIESADIALNTLTLLCGHNESGKTSISQGVAAALTSKPNVMGITKKEADALVRDGAKTASIRILRGKDDGIVVRWPSLEIEGKGKPPASSPIAAGLIRFSSLNQQDAAQILLDVLKAHPTKEDFVKVAGAYAGEKSVLKVWDMIERDGWDTTHNYLLDQARNLKAEWKVIAGENWGSQKAETWLPAAYTPDLDTASDEQLVQAVEDARIELEKGIASQAVDQNYIEQLRAEANKLPNLKTEYNKVEDELKALETEQKEKTARRSQLPASTKTITTWKCPHCSNDIAQEPDGRGGMQLVKADKMSDEKLKEMRTEVAQLDGRLSWLKTTINAKTMEKGRIHADGVKAREAKEKLKALGLQDDTGAGDKLSESAVQLLRANHENAIKRRDAFTKRQQILALNKRINSMLAVAEEVAPSGLRQRKAGEAVDLFNTKTLAPLCEKFDIKPVTIDLNMHSYLGTRQYRFLSESAKFRVDTVIQVGIALLDGSDAVVIDGADIIVPSQGRVGLFKMLLATKKPCLVSMSLGDAKATPDLKSKGGAVYWLENSKANKIEEKSA